MDLLKLSITLLLVLKTILEVDCFVDPLTFITGSAIIGFVSYLYKNPETKDPAIKYTYRAIDKACQMIGMCEGCEDYWIPSNLKALEFELKSEVFGQSLAVEIVLSAVKNHLRNKNPKRSLVLSFHGSPGTGKNFVSSKILKNLFKKGDKTRYVEFYGGTKDFQLKSEVGKYKEQLIETIKDKVYECHRSVFVFDEIEKMPDGILDVISGFVRAQREGDLDYRRVIFILLSNVGSEALTIEAIKAWELGIPREDMIEKELSKILAEEAYNRAGGLQHTRLIKNHDVSYYVPFLPLEKQHIIQCLEREISDRGQIMSEELKEQVLEEMNFYPPNEQIFSTSGCKKVAEAADRLIEREFRRRRKAEREHT